MSLSIKCNKTSDLMVNVSVPESFPVQIKLICTSFKHFLPFLACTLHTDNRVYGKRYELCLE